MFQRLLSINLFIFNNCKRIATKLSYFKVTVDYLRVLKFSWTYITFTEIHDTGRTRMSLILTDFYLKIPKVDILMFMYLLVPAQEIVSVRILNLNI